MAWDKKKHKVLITKKSRCADNSVIIVEAYSYDKGPTRIGIKHKIEKANGESLELPIKGLTLEQAAKVPKLLKKVLEELEE